MKHFLLVLGICAAAGSIPAQRPQPPVPPSFDVVEQPIASLHEAMRQGTVTSRDLVEIYLSRIEAYDRRGPRLNAIVAVNPRARDEADALDRERRERGPRGPLHGIPVVVKDNFDLAGLPTTAGTIAFVALYPADDAFQVKKLREAGAVILAKTNLHELASGITTIGSATGQTRNPYDLSRNPGGSSGGTGAAVAANFAAAGLGTDTCGSIRIPASHNALVGLRGTFGLSSRDGVLPLSHSQDVAGPLGRTVMDVAVMLDATVGTDPADESTRLGEGRRAASYRAALKVDALEGARIGVLTSMFGTASEDNEAGGVVRRAVEAMRKKGAVISEVTVPGLDELLNGSSLIDAEFKFDLAQYLAGVPNPPIKSLGEILDKGLHHAAVEASIRRRNAVEKPESESSRRARIKRDAVRAAVLATLEEHRLDALLYPTMRRKPALVGEAQAGSTCQLSASSGLPALSVPAGFTNDGLPIGLELLGGPFTEARLLSLAYAFEQPEPARRAPFSTPAFINGRPPAPSQLSATVRRGAVTVMSVRFTFDPLTGELKYEATTSGLAPADILAAWIHRGAEGENGAAVYQVLGREETAGSGVVRIPPADHARLREGRYYLMLYTRDHPGGLRARFVP